MFLFLFSCQVRSDSLQPHELHHARLPYPWLSPRVCSDSMSTESEIPSNHLILCHLLLLLSCPQSFPASGSFPMNWFFPWCGQSTGTSASSSVLPMNIKGWFPLRLTGLISLLSKGLSRFFSSTSVQKHQFFGTQSSLWPNSHIHRWLWCALLLKPLNSDPI